MLHINNAGYFLEGFSLTLSSMGGDWCKLRGEHFDCHKRITMVG